MDVCSKEFSSAEDESMLAMDAVYVSKQSACTDNPSEEPSTVSSASTEVNEEPQEAEIKPEPTELKREETPKYTLRAELMGCNGPITSVKFSPNGRLVAAGSVDKSFRVWEAHGQYAELTKCRSHSAGINDIAWSRDNRYLASCGDDGVVKVYDLQWTKRKLAIQCHDKYIMSVAFNTQGTLLLTASFDNTAKMWDMRSGDCVASLEEHKQPLSCASFNHDSSMIVTTSYDATTILWDTRTAGYLKILEMADDDGKPLPSGFAKFSPNGRYILAAKSNSKMCMLDAKKAKVVRTYEGHLNQDYCVVADFSITGRKCIVSGSENGNIYVWDMQTCELLQVIKGSPGGSPVLAVDSNRHYNMIASASIGSGDKIVRLWRSEA
uniref:WD_REPEATS_REGION domain-containing protein n=1 Tax=Steinernema glaseri TaxID=37863 RepID=A0A1I8AK91_9BILA